MANSMSKTRSQMEMEKRKSACRTRMRRGIRHGSGVRSGIHCVRTGVLRDQHSRGRLERVGPQIVEGCETQPVTVQMPADHTRRHVVFTVGFHYHQLAAVPATTSIYHVSLARRNRRFLISILSWRRHERLFVFSRRAVRASSK